MSVFITVRNTLLLFRGFYRLWLREFFKIINQFMKLGARVHLSTGFGVFKNNGRVFTRLRKSIIQQKAKKISLLAFVIVFHARIFTQIFNEHISGRIVSNGFIFFQMLAKMQQQPKLIARIRGDNFNFCRGFRQF